LWSKQCGIGPANTQFGLLPRIGVRTNRRRQANGFCPDLALNRFAWSRIARASGKPDRKGHHRNGQQYCARQQRAIQPQPRPQEFAAIICTVHRIRHRRSDHSDTWRGRLRPPLATKSRAAATMDGKFESQSNNYDE
jgi:hypothetical protein